MAILRLTIGNIKIFVIQVHAPTSDSAEEEVDLFYDMLDNLLSSKTTGEKVIIFGDFNARIGKSKLGENRTNGIYGVGVRNERGEKLLDFALCNNLKIMNTFFEGNGMDHQTERRNTREEEPELRVPDILEQEIKQAIKQLKKNKAPGDDDITNEVIISGLDVLMSTIKLLFSKILKEKRVPSA
ncbi:craniofacial development protein 2-like [Nilaparvata lugens]|uniref:craniofacial development protein 2-like n=1 Tax=Nilaparvata lugens TaxID=108931 RepID=UPI00193E94BF|nr:craniofacial development protein 2-like [Nilaparvata lugens]